jgi:hypothetical protein
MKKNILWWLISLIVSVMLFGGTYWWSEQVTVGSGRILGTAVASSPLLPVRVLRIVKKNAETVIILPRESVFGETIGSYVLTLTQNQAEKTLVTGEVWREKYVRISDGLNDEDLVILDERVVVGQIITDYQVINAEAGQSGVVN